jgi:two-component system sensor histidine kinase PrrB
MTLRARVALATAAAVLLTVSVSGVALVALFTDAQLAALDERLSSRVQVAARAIETADIADIREVSEEALGQLDDNASSAGLSVRVAGADGSEQLFGGFPSGVADQAAGLSTFETDAGQRWRSATEVALAPGRLGAARVTVAESLEATDEAIARVRTLVLQVGLLAVAVAAGAGWFLGRRALWPIERLRRDAAGLADTADLSARVGVDHSSPEIETLGRTLNRLLERVEEGDTERRAALESARSFAADAAHELRNPLTVMQADLDLLLNDTPSPQETREILVELDGQQQRLGSTLEALRTIALADLRRGPQRTDVDVEELVAAARDQVLRRFDHVSVQIDSGLDDLHVLGWADGLRLAIANIIENAAVHGRGDDGSAVVTVELDGDGDVVVVTVKDRGPGIAVGERARVLGRFERGRTAADGSGLGLAIAAQQVDLHGGTLDLDDVEGGGLAVSIRLPRTPPTPR